MPSLEELWTRRTGMREVPPDVRGEWERRVKPLLESPSGKWQARIEADELVDQWLLATIFRKVADKNRIRQETPEENLSLMGRIRGKWREIAICALIGVILAIGSYFAGWQTRKAYYEHYWVEIEEKQNWDKWK